jgi:choline dehydrogenase-like flavoprotein
MIFEGIEQYRASGFSPRVAVIGSGPAGMTVARKLGAANIQVVVLEAGGADFSPESQEFYKGKVVGDEYFDLDVTRLRYLGGSSNHWGGWCRVLDAHDFLAKPYAPNTGWPITRAAIEPFLPEMESILEIAPFWPDRAISQDLRQFDLIKSSRVNFGEKYRPEIEASRNVALVLDTELSELAGDGRRISAVRLWSGGAPAGEIAPDYVVVAAGGLENSRLLLWSNERSNGGVVPQAAALGRYWMEHPMYTVGDAVITNGDAFLWDGDGEAFVTPTPEAMALRGILNFHIEIEPVPHSEMTKYLADLACYAPDLTDWVAEGLDMRLRCGARVHIDWEQAPRPDNRIVLSATDRDPGGVPLMELHWTKDAFDRRTMVEGTRLFGESIAAADLGRLRISDWVLDGSPYPEGMELAGNHHMGGTRMGTDPAVSVVDADCKVHGMDNLYVAGSSVFATCGQANPTATIVALALRLGEHLARTAAS